MLESILLTNNYKKSKSLKLLREKRLVSSHSLLTGGSMKNIDYFLRSVPNKTAQRNHLFLKRAFECDNYYYGEEKKNTADIWCQFGFPEVILIQRYNGWELAFPFTELNRIYFSFIKRKEFYMCILSDTVIRAPLFYSYTSYPSLRSLAGNIPL